MEDKAVIVATPLDLIARANQSDASIEQMERLFDLQLRWEKNEALKAYNEALANFKAKNIKIIKDALVDFTSSKGRTRYKHATLGNAVEQVTPSMSEFGLSNTWDVSQSGTSITVTCKVRHKLGHCESVSMCADADTSGNKNSIQGVGSTVTYLERYTLLSALGLATYEDDDGRGSARQEKEKPEVKHDPAIMATIEKANSMDELSAAWQAIPVGLRHAYADAKDFRKSELTAGGM